MSTTTKNITVKINAEIDKFNSSMKTLSSKIDTAKKDFEGLSKAGEALTSLGTKLTAGITVPIGAMAIAGTKASIDLDSAFAGVRKTLDVSGKTAKETEKIYKDMENGIMELSQKMPTAATEIAGVAEAAGQLGIKTENVLGFTEVMVKLGDTTNMSADDAATALARLANITGMPQTEFDRLGSTIVALGNNLATTEGEITEMALRLAGAGAQVGMTEADILSFSGALSSVGINAEAGGSAFSKVMIDMASSVDKGGKRLEQFASVAGMSASEFKKAFEEDAAGAIIAFIQGLGNAEEQGKSAIGILEEMGIKEVVLRDSLLRAAGASDVFTDAVKIGNDAWKENSALTNEANQRYETTASKIEIAKNKIVAVGKEIGDRLIPVVEKCVDWISDMCDKFLELDPTIQNVILIFGGLLAVIPPIITVVGALMKGMATLKIASAVLGVGLGTVTAGFIAIPVAIAAAIAIIAALIANWDWVKEKAKELAEKVGEAWNNLTKTFGDNCKKLWEDLTNALSDMGTAISDWFTGVGQWFVDGWNACVNATTDFFTNLWNTISDWFTGLVDSISGWFSDVAQWFSDGWNLCVDKTKEIFTKIGDAVSEAFDFIGNLVELGFLMIKELFNIAKELILAPWRILWENCKDFIIPIWENITNFISEKLELVKSFVSEKLEAVKNFFTEKFTAAKDKTVEIYEAISSVVSEKLEKVKNFVSEKTQQVADFFSEKWNKAKDKTTETYQNISETVSSKLEETKTKASEKLQAVSESFNEKWNKAKDKTSEVYQAISSTVSEKLEQAKSSVSDKVNAIKNYFSERFESAKQAVSNKMDSIKQNIQSKINSAKDIASNAINTIKSKFDIFGTIASNVSSKFDNIKKSITDKMNSARDTVKNVIDKIKGFFNITLNFPKIKVPVFGFSGKFSINPPSVPSFGIKSWKWLNKGGIFKHKTVLPSGYGVGDKSFGGVGNNPEVVAPLDKLRDMLFDNRKPNDGGLHLNIQEFNNNRDYDIEKLADELAYYLKRKQVFGGA